MKTEAQEKLCGFGNQQGEGMLKEPSFGGALIRVRMHSNTAALVEAKLCMQGLL